jgi:predicted MFS family arabinose efflux permease
VLLGAAGRFIITGALSWGLALGGPQNTGKDMSWLGVALYAAFAVGAPAGAALYARSGLAAIALAVTLIPLVTLFLVAPLRVVAPPPAARPPLFRRHSSRASIALLISM